MEPAARRAEAEGGADPRAAGPPSAAPPASSPHLLLPAPLSALSTLTGYEQGCTCSTSASTSSFTSGSAIQHVPPASVRASESLPALREPPSPLPPAALSCSSLSTCYP
eukprot:1378869-Rhodomonas_salina.2